MSVAFYLLHVMSLSTETKCRVLFHGFKLPVVVNYEVGGKAGNAEAWPSEPVFPSFPSLAPAVAISHSAFGFPPSRVLVVSSASVVHRGISSL